MTQKSKSPDAKPVPQTGKGSLYVVATPIGNLSDMTFRAVDTLKQVALIACEDTRISQKLCNHFGIKTKLLAYHDHNAATALPKCMASLEAGQDVALISDAGTPLVSDPGYRLVCTAIEGGIQVIPVPGASSLLCALSAAGLPTDRVYFGGFLPSKSQARRQALQSLAIMDTTLVLLESNRRLPATLQDMAEFMGDRPAVIARELTKTFEEFRRGSIEELARYYQAHPEVKGEIVILIAPSASSPTLTSLEPLTPLMQALLPHYPVKQIATLLAQTLDYPRKALYDRLLDLREPSS